MRSADVKCPPNQEGALHSLCFRSHYPIGGLEIKVEVAHCSTPKPNEYIHNANIANANANEMQQNATRCLRYKAKMSKVQLERLKHYFWAPLPFSCCCLNKQHTQKTMSSKNREAAKKQTNWFPSHTVTADQSFLKIFTLRSFSQATLLTG